MVRLFIEGNEEAVNKILAIVKAMTSDEVWWIDVAPVLRDEAIVEAL